MGLCIDLEHPSQKKNNEEEKVMEQIKKKEKTKQVESLQKTLSFNFKYNKIIKINELSNKSIGILLDDSFQIYNLNNLKKINEMQLPIISYDSNKKIKDFIELKNSDLILFSSKKIFFYKLSGKKYKLYHSIDKFEENDENKEREDEEREEEEDDINYNERKKFEINSIYELTNGKLVCCNSFGLIIYIKVNKKYILESKHEMEVDVRKIIEIDTNKLI